MGCRISRNGRCGAPGIADLADLGRQPTLERMMADPDLGWRHVMRDHQFTSLDSISNVAFFNDRSAAICSLPLAALAVNIAQRAAALARHFGVTGELESSAFSPNIEETKKIYRILDIPDEGWRLLERNCRRKPEHSVAPGNIKAEEKTKKGDEERCVFLSKVQRKRLTPVVADVAEIGMNIAEQLNRLEKGNEERNEYPTNTFGWKITNHVDGNRIAISSPEHDAYWIIPEELILNTTTWVQNTYLTQPILT